MEVSIGYGNRSDSFEACGGEMRDYFWIAMSKRTFDSAVIAIVFVLGLYGLWRVASYEPDNGWEKWPIVAVDQHCEYRDGRPCTYALHCSPDGRTHNDSIEGRWTLEELRVK
jgi:hypothetical protein